MSSPVPPNLGQTLSDTFGGIANAYVARQQAEQRAQQDAVRQLLQGLQAQNVQSEIAARNVETQGRQLTQQQLVRKQQREDEIRQGVIRMMGPVTALLQSGAQIHDPAMIRAVGQAYASDPDPEVRAEFEKRMSGLAAIHGGLARAATEETGAQTASIEAPVRRARAGLEGAYLQTPEGRRLVGRAAAGTLGAVEEEANRAQRERLRGDADPTLTFPRIGRAQYLMRRLPQLIGKIGEDGNLIDANRGAQLVGQEYDTLRAVHVHEQRVPGPPANATARVLVPLGRRTRSQLLAKGYTDPEARAIMQNSGFNIQ